IDCTTVDLNPFLVWLARAKTARYDEKATTDAASVVERMARAARSRSGKSFVPDIHRVERWWDRDVLGALGGAAAVVRGPGPGVGARAKDLALLALCRALIDTG